MSLENPNWFNHYDRLMYDKIISIPDKDLTEEQRRFVHTMYHFEEYACGLDGDR